MSYDNKQDVIHRYTCYKYTAAWPSFWIKKKVVPYFVLIKYIYIYISQRDDHQR